MPVDQLSGTLSALADPTRRAILARLAAADEASVTELAAPFAMSLPAVSKHLKVLERAGLITRGREAQWRPCRLDAAPLREVAAYLEGYRQFWDESYARLDALLEAVQSEGKKKQSARRDGPSRTRRPTSVRWAGDLDAEPEGGERG